jgi:hypothetical protein
MKSIKRRGRPPGSKNKPRAKAPVIAAEKLHPSKKDNLSPWLNEVSDLNQEVNALRRQLNEANVIIKYLEYQLGLKHYEDSSI